MHPGSNDQLFYYLRNLATLGSVLNHRSTQVSRDVPACLEVGLDKLSEVPALHGSTIVIATLEAAEHIPIVTSILGADPLPVIAAQTDAINSGLMSTVSKLQRSNPGGFKVRAHNFYVLYTILL